MYADLLPDQEEDIVLPAETLWFLEKKMWDFLGLILKEAHRMWGPQATPNYFYGKARKPVWGDPQVCVLNFVLWHLNFTQIQYISIVTEIYTEN